MLGSLLFTFCGFNLLHFVHPNAVAVIAHIPWLLWASTSSSPMRGGARWSGPQAAIALLTGSQLLLGYPQYLWFSLLAEAGYAIFVALQPPLQPPRRLRRQRRRACDCVGCETRTWPRVVLAKGSGVLLGGVQLWPTLDALQPEHAAGRRRRRLPRSAPSIR